MVETSLPFWLHPPSRTMSSFSTGMALLDDSNGAFAMRSSPAEPPAPVCRAGEFRVQLCDLDAVMVHAEAWAGLVDRALEPNVFVEPVFALAAARHFPVARRPVFLLVWAGEIGGGSVLVGLCPLQIPRFPPAARIASVWTHEQATTSAPLLDRDRAGAALDALLSGLAGLSPRLTGLIITGLEVGGPLWRLLADRKPETLHVIEQRVRAVLDRADRVGTSSAEPSKETRRQRRRLAEQGTLRLRVAAGAEEVRDATEQFLFLESLGWKGRRGTALLHSSMLASFARAMTRGLAHEGKCRIYSLDLDERPVAMGVVLSSGTRAYFWKTAYDQALQRHSPGKQLALALTQDLLREASIELTDSCAVPDHPMIDRLWAGRMSVADVVVGAPQAPALAGAAARLRFGRRCRAMAKRWMGRVRRRLPR